MDNNENNSPNAAAEPTKPTKDEGEGITVAVRVRPMNKEKEKKASWHALQQYNAIAQLNEKNEVVQSTVFTVDKVFDDSTSTATLYQSVCSNVIKSVVGGINGTIFAYGQTSSGKTHTMQGGGDSVGVLQLAAEEIFSLIQACPDREYSMKVSYMEIYNENLRDLLSNGGKQEVQIRENAVSGIHIECENEQIESIEDIQKCLRKGEQFRVVGATAMNERSSRSHAIFRLTIESEHTNEHGEKTKRRAALNLVDLAGSESVRNTGATGQRAKEGGKINQSLLALSTVIKQLGDGGAHGHVNFRDSKLTRLLQPMLLGNATMALICCITPAEQFAEETRSTLQFATRAKNVRLNPLINEVVDKDAQLKKAQRELSELKQRLEGNNLGDSRLSQSESEQLRQELAAAQARIAQFQQEQFLAGAGGGSLSSSSKSARSKRHRETWCPGERGAPLPGPMSPQPAPTNRRRLSEGLNESPDWMNDDLTLPALQVMLKKKKTADLSEVQVEKEAMYEQLCVTEQQYETLRFELANLQEHSTTKIAELEVDIEEKLGRIQILEQMLEEQKEQSAEMESDQLELVSEVKELKSLIEKLQECSEAEGEEKLAHSEAEIKRLEADLIELSSKLEVCEKEKETLSMDNEGLLEDLEDTQEQLKNAKEANVVQESNELKIAVARIAELEAAATEEARLLSMAQERVAELEANVETSSQTASTMEAELNSAKTEIEALTSQLESIKVATEQMKEENKTAVQEKDARIEELESEVVSSIETFEAKISKLEAEVEAKDQTVEESSLKLQSETESMTSKIQELEAKVKERDENISRFESLLADKEVSHTAEVDEMSTELSNLADQLQEKDTELTAAKEAMEEAVLNSQSALATELAETKAELEDCKQQLVNDVRLLEQNKANESSLERSNADCQRLRNDLTTRDVELKELREAHSELETELRVLKENMTSKLAAQQQEDAQVNSKKASQQVAQISILQNDLNNVTAKLSSTEAQLKKLNASSEKKIEKYEKELHEMSLKVSTTDDLTFKCKGLEAALASAETRVKQLKESNDEAQKNATAAAIAADKFEAQVTALTATIESNNNGGLKAELERLQLFEKESLAELKRLQGDKKSIETRLQKSKTEMDMLREEALLVGELQSKVAEMEILLESHDPEYVEKLESSVRDLQAELLEVKECMEAAIDDKKQLIEESQKSVQEVSQQFELKCSEAEAKIESLERSLNESKEEINKLIEEKSNQTEAMNEMSQQCMELDENMLTLENQLVDAQRSSANEANKASELLKEKDELSGVIEAKHGQIQQLTAQFEEKINNLTITIQNLEAAKSAAASSETISNAVSVAEAKFKEDIALIQQESNKKLAEAQRIIKEKDIRIEELDQVKFTEEMKEMFQKKFAAMNTLKSENAAAKKTIQEQKAEMEAMDLRIADLEMKKVTLDIQEKFNQMIQDRDQARSKVKLLNAEVESLRANVLSSSSSSSGNSGSSSAENSLLKKQLEDERNRCYALEQKFSQEMVQAKDLRNKAEAASHCVSILRVALKHESENLSIIDLPQLALDISQKLNEANDAEKKVALLEEQQKRFHEERSSVMMSQAETNSILEESKIEKLNILSQLESARNNIVELESKLSEIKSSQDKALNEMAKSLDSKDREKKFLEQENLSLILENKDFKKQASAARYELETLKQQSNKSPSLLGLAPPSAPSSSSSSSMMMMNNDFQLNNSSVKNTPLSHIKVDGKENTSNTNLNISSSSSSSTMKQPQQLKQTPKLPPTSAGFVAPNELIHPTTSCVDVEEENPGGCKQS